MVEIQREAFGFPDPELVPNYVFDMTGWSFAMLDKVELIGFALCSLRDEHGALELILQQLGVDRWRRREGIATEMMKQLRQYVATQSGLHISSIRWQQDPMLAGVARLYIGKVGGRGFQLVRNKWGKGLGGKYVGLPTHRIDVKVAPSPEQVEIPAFPEHSTQALIVSDPQTVPTIDWERVMATAEARMPVTLRIPEDFEALKTRDLQGLAAPWQETVCLVLERLLGRGYEISAFRKLEGFGEYLLTTKEPEFIPVFRHQ